MASKVLHPEGRALTCRAKAAWSVARTDAAKHFGGVGRDSKVTRSGETGGNGGETGRGKGTATNYPVSGAVRSGGANGQPGDGRDVSSRPRGRHRERTVRHQVSRGPSPGFPRSAS